VDYVLIVSSSARPLNPETRKSLIRVGNVTGYTDTGYPGNGRSTTGGCGLSTPAVCRAPGLR